VGKQFTLGRRDRLKSRKQIEQLFNQGKSFSLYPFKIVYAVTNTSSPNAGISFAVSASARNFKKAVERNRIKRLIREAYRLQNTGLKDKLRESNRRLNLFFIYTGKEIPGFSQIRERTQLVLERLIKLLDEKPASHT
jgi:ribonuclease P protein component